MINGKVDIWDSTDNVWLQPGPGYGRVVALKVHTSFTDSPSYKFKWNTIELMPNLWTWITRPEEADQQGESAKLLGSGLRRSSVNT